MKILKHLVIFSTLFIAIFLTIYYEKYVEMYWGLVSLLFLLLLLLEFVFLFEDKVAGSKDVAMISILGAISAASRVPFAGIPSVQPSTFIIILTGYTLGSYAGFMVGMETALLSNFLLGQGPWTPWQMLAWGLAGVFGAMLKFLHGYNYEIYALMAFGFAYGYIYGIIMNLWYWLAFIYPHTLASFLMVESLSVYFDTLHALGNLIFIDLFGARFIEILERYRKRFLGVKREKCAVPS